MLPSNSGEDVVTDQTKHHQTHSPDTPAEPPRADDDVIRIEDLAPRTDVSGGRKILLGEYLTPVSTPRIPPGS